MAAGDIVAAVADPANAGAVNAIRQVAQQLGVDPNLALATAYHESGFNTTAVGDQGTSFGLFQLHKGGELGGLTQQQAFDPTTNARVALGKLRSIITPTSGKQPTPGEVAAAAQRPANPAAYAIAVDGLYAQLTGQTGVAGSDPNSPYGESIFTGPVGGTAGGGQTEGFLIDQQIVKGTPNVRLSRSTVRKIVGGAVLVSGALVALAGIFLLTGGRAPGPAQLVQGAIQARTGRRASRAAQSMSETTPDELAVRRQARARSARQRSQVDITRSARAAGETDAEAAGDF